MQRKAERPAAPAELAGWPDVWPRRAGYSRGDLIYDRYHVMHRPPPGGVNDVYLCIEMGALDYVAVKIPRPRGEDVTGSEHWEIFQEEVRNWAQLGEHPNVTRCQYAGARDGRWFLVLEWVGAPDAGRDLQGHLGAMAAMDPDTRLRELVRIAHDVCDGLAFIHANGIVHGDLKPSNVLLDKTGRAKITDLGTGSPVAAAGRRVARAAQPPDGTPEYQAPELRDRALQERRRGLRGGDLRVHGCPGDRALEHRHPLLPGEGPAGVR